MCLLRRGQCGSFAPGKAWGTAIPERAILDEAVLRAKHDLLVRILEDCESVCVGYSGGVDSVYLARAAVEVLGAERVLAVTGRSASYPAVQHDVALENVRRFGIPHLEVDTHELAVPGYSANGSDRCFHCKDELWSRLGEVARVRGLRTVVDGSNADDAHDHRPGAQAGSRHGVRSPLQEAGLTKAEIRALSRRAGLPTWDQPASPCLASRLAYGLAVTPERLAQVERAEAALRRRGLVEFRVRHHGDVARIEVAPAEMGQALAAVMPEVEALLGLGFERVLLDVEGYRRGALNEGLAEGLVQLEVR
jgi:pyridinium-3,5-biscarboxylic acid mononucleotide sulfurtransferase